MVGSLVLYLLFIHDAKDLTCSLRSRVRLERTPSELVNTNCTQSSGYLTKECHSILLHINWPELGPTLQTKPL